jgi:hypothetical protein
LTGRVEFSLLSEIRPEIVIDEISTTKPKAYTGRQNEIQLHSFENNHGHVAIHITVKQRQAANPDDYSWANSIIQRFELVDANGVKYQPNGWGNQHYSQTSMTVALNFMKPANAVVGPPSRLTLVEWVTVNQKADFTFKNVELP